MGLFEFFRSAAFLLPPETAHAFSLKALKYGLYPRSGDLRDPRLQISLGGLDFPNPVGLAAGYDKNAEVPDAVLKLGFGFCEIGTLTPRPQSGNPKPRVFRLLHDEALINRLGFNNAGHAQALARLKARADRGGIVGVNIGANKNSKDFVADYDAGIEFFFDVASYFTANISSPNTPGLRNLQAGETLKVLIERIFATIDKCEEKSRRKVPVFLKIAPDLERDQISEIADIVANSRLSALIVSNTTLERVGLFDKRQAVEAGGLSGRPLFEKSTGMLARIYTLTNGKIPLIGVGGISSIEQAIAKIEAGASLLQLYTGLVYAGPCLPAEIIRGLGNHLEKTGATNISEVVGSKAELWC